MCLLKPNFLCEPERFVGLCTLPNGKRELLVRWKNMTYREDTWEPEELFYNTAMYRELMAKIKFNEARRARQNALQIDAIKSTTSTTTKKCIHCGKIADD